MVRSSQVCAKTGSRSDASSVSPEVQESIIYEFKPYLLSGGIRDAPDAALLFDAITACGYRSQPNLVRAHQAFLDAAHITGPQL